MSPQRQLQKPCHVVWVNACISIDNTTIYHVHQFHSHSLNTDYKISRLICLYNPSKKKRSSESKVYCMSMFITNIAHRIIMISDWEYDIYTHTLWNHIHYFGTYVYDEYWYGSNHKTIISIFSGNRWGNATKHQ